MWLFVSLNHQAQQQQIVPALQNHDNHFNQIIFEVTMANAVNLWK